MSTFNETDHPRNHPTGASRFSEKAHSEPEAALSGAEADSAAPSGLSPDAEALQLLRAGAPAGLNKAQTAGWNSVYGPSATIADEWFSQQPLGYVAHHLRNNEKLARDGTAGYRLASNPVTGQVELDDFWNTRAGRLGSLAARFEELSGTVPKPQPAAHDQARSADVLDQILTDYRLNTVKPVGISQTRAALRNARGQGTGSVRNVELSWDSVPAGARKDDFDVVGPKDGRPLIVDVHSGFPILRVKSGSVVVIAASNAGHSIHAGPGSHVKVIARSGRKVGVTAEEGSDVDLYCNPGSRGFQSVAEGATFTVHGDRREIRLSTDPR